MHLSPVISQKKINAEIKLFDDKSYLGSFLVAFSKFPRAGETSFHPSF
jgi:hypothetical protein